MSFYGCLLRIGVIILTIFILKEEGTGKMKNWFVTIEVVLCHFRELCKLNR
jgi:hypothetical protein